MHLRILVTVAIWLFSLGAHAEIEQPKIMSSDKWILQHQKFSKEGMEPNPRPFAGIVIHHTANVQRQWRLMTTAQKMQSYHRIHLGNVQKYRLKGQRWGGFAYHYLIDVDGQIAEGRSIEFIGDSDTDYEMSGLLLVVLEGNFEGGKTQIRRDRLAEFAGQYTGDPQDKEDDKTRVYIKAKPDQPTAAQKKSLDALVAWLAKTHKVKASTIKGHKELVKKTTTSCPGMNLWTYIPTLIATTQRALAEETGR